MYLEITNDIHLGLKFGCCNAENRRREGAAESVHLRYISEVKESFGGQRKAED